MMRQEDYTFETPELSNGLLEQPSLHSEIKQLTYLELWIRFPTPWWWLTALCNASPKGIQCLWVSLALYTCSVQRECTLGGRTPM